ncbi:hypothetical protein ABT301_29215 [Streptomyces sp. NPDC000987]|uniref:hypothetical protein n=1 Tax=Streptomyces sp. NPDC000987 TaxID=3154374 RepID=UPI00331EB47C
MTATRKLTGGQRAVLILATVPMVGFGGLGAVGTFTNITAEFGRKATALGVVAAGEGVTFVLALVMVLLTMLGQAAPWPVRAGLWLTPAAAALTGAVVADNLTEAVVYGITPMAMCASGEGIGLVARRIFVYRTQVDVEAMRRNADLVRRVAYHRARAERHPWKPVQKWSELVAWRLMRRAGEGDARLGVDLVGVQRVRLAEGADLALGDMLTGGSPAPALPAGEPAPEPARESEPEPIAWFDEEPEPDTEPEPDDEPEPEPAREPEPPHGEPPHPGLSLTKDPAQPVDGQHADKPGASPAHPDPEPGDDQGKEPDDERETNPSQDVEQRQILQLAGRLQTGEQLTKTSAAPLLGVSPATAGRRLMQARRVVKLAELLKAGERLTPATAATLLGVHEETAGQRLTEARHLTGEGTGFYA